MKEVKSIITENCIFTPTSCSAWNGGDIEYLGICDGDQLNNLLWEVINKLQGITGDDLSNFSLDSLLDICKQTAPAEVTLLSILTLLKNNQVCLKEFMDSLNTQLVGLNLQDSVNVDLKCYADFDNQGNALSMTKAQLDQLIINNLCDQKGRITQVEGELTVLQSQVDNINTTFTVDEPIITTCIDASPKRTSLQLQSVATNLCNYKGIVGSEVDVPAALAKTPSTDNTRYSTIIGWDLTPDNLTQSYGNLVLKVAKLEADLIFMQNNCCALTCDDIKLGFSAVFNDDMDGIIIKFSSGAGTKIPAGVIDKGSTGTFTDVDGNVETFTLIISNNYQVEVPISGLSLSGNVEVSISAVMGTSSLTCEKCLNKSVKSSSCGYCEISATGDGTAQAVIIYESTGLVTFAVPSPLTTTTTTTTTAGS